MHVKQIIRLIGKLIVKLILSCLLSRVRRWTVMNWTVYS
jgi:hypothetical protein